MKKIILFLALCVFGFSEDISTITNEGTQSLPTISIQDTSSSIDPILSPKIYKLIVGDVKVGAVFNVVDNQPNSNLLLKYQFARALDNSLNLDVEVFENGGKKSVFSKKFSISDDKKYPFLVHDAISEVIKNVGYADVDWMKDMIVFSRYTSSKNSEILLSDYTLSYKQTVIQGGLNIFPKWANSAKSSFYYTTYINNMPVIYKYALDSGKKEKIFEGKGMTIVSDVSSDGQKLLITNAPEDQADIFLYDLKTKNIRKITDYSGIDVSGNFIDNDSKIVFVSDRLGYPNVFMTSLAGNSAVTQLVYHGKNNNSISTNKNNIVYSSREDNGGFNLYIMSINNNLIRQLTADGKNLYPRLSKDGGTILYIKQAAGQSAVGIIRLNENRNFHFPLNLGKLQSLDW